MALFPSTVIASAAGGYDIDNSCRFNDDDAPYLARTPSSTGNQRTYTYSYWFKIGNISSGNFHLFNRHTSGEGGGRYLLIEFKTDNTMRLISGNAATLSDPTSTSMQLITTRVFRDVSSWYHFVIAVDTTQGTASNRVKLYINGVQETNFSTATYPSQNDIHFINHTNTTMEVGGASTWSGTQYKADGHMAELHCVDGTALGASDFGEVDEDYGHWKSKKYSGSHGTNGFHLDFANSGSLGNDAAGSNNFTPTNLAASDQMLDSPTNNFSTLNSIWNYGSSSVSGTLTEGNLKTSFSGHGPHSHPNTMPVSSGKWYWEVQIHNVGNNAGRIGICTTQCLTRDGTPQAKVDTILLRYDGALMIGTGATTHTGYSTSFATGTKYLLSFMLNLDDNEIEIKVNGVTGGGAKSIPAGEYEVMSDFMSTAGSFVHWYNWGQDGTFAGEKTAQGNSDSEDIGNFYYAVPSGFKALCTKNLPEPAVKPKEHFNIILYDDGAGAKTGVGFQPDLVWLKSRGSGYSHKLIDAVRGVTKALVPNEPDIEYTDATGLTAFGSYGFTVGAAAPYSDTTGAGMVAWNWKANGAGSSNTNGSINTTATSANVAAGFSISTYTGTGNNYDTVGHGLSVAPNLVIVKKRDTGNDTWLVGSIQPVGSLDFTDNLVLNTNAAATDNDTRWYDTAPTSTVFSIGTNNEVNQSGVKYVAYCWHDVAGYSRVGSYVANNNADGPFVYTGFRPRFIMFKGIDSASNWAMIDTVREPNGNPSVKEAPYAEQPYAESGTTYYKDILSNGFKLRITTSAFNTGSNKYLYIAFAEHPFKYTTAR